MGPEVGVTPACFLFPERQSRQKAEGLVPRFGTTEQQCCSFLAAAAKSPPSAIPRKPVSTLVPEQPGKCHTSQLGPWSCCLDTWDTHRLKHPHVRLSLPLNLMTWGRTCLSPAGCCVPSRACA